MSSFGMWIAIYCAGAVVGLLCWLPYYFGVRRWIREWRDAYRGQYDEVVRKHEVVVDVSRQLVGATEKASRLEGERDKLLAEVKGLRRKIEALEKEGLRLSGEIGAHKRVLAEAERRLGEVRNELAELQAKFDASAADWRVEKTQLEASLAEANARIVELKDRIAAIEAAAVGDAAAWEAERIALTRRFDAAKGESAERIATIEAERTALAQQLDAAKAESTSLRDRVAEVESNAAAAATDWQIQENKFRDEINSLTRSARERLGRIGELESERAETSRLLDEEKKAADELRKKKDALDADIESQKRLVEAATEKARAAEGDLKHSEHQVRELGREIASLQKQLKVPKPKQSPHVTDPGGDSRLTLGVDFGTHSTKVVFRGHGNSNLSWVFRWDEPTSGYASFASPSLVRLNCVDGTLAFGAKALRQCEGKLYRNLKLDLLPVADDQEKAPDGELSTVLAALYLAWVLRNAMTTLRFNPKRISLNVGAPMKRKDEEVYNRYLRVVHAAWELAFSHEEFHFNGSLHLENVKPAVLTLLDKEVPPAAIRNFAVMPETLCPLVSMSRDPSQKGAGVTMVVDMGAGTTEFSINNLLDGDERIHCLWDNTYPIGGDLFAVNDAARLGLDSYRQREADLARQVMTHLREVWQKGYLRHRDKTAMERGAWDKLRIVKVGGGLRRQRLESEIDGLKQPPNLDQIRDSSRVCQAEWLALKELAFWDESIPEPIDNLPLLGVAHGLSIHRKQWPEYLSPREIDDTGPPAMVEVDPYERRH